jgi:protein-L-isoaspartate(D-aspartate) O-methyltransferase
MRATVILTLAFTLAGGVTRAASDARQRERDEMVDEQLASREITHAATLAAMRKVPRHRFVPEQLARSAYADSPLPIGHGQTISQPLIVAFMTQTAQITRDSKVLEIGTGSGYQAAVLAQLAGHVYTIEIVPVLAQSARQILRRLGYSNVSVRQGDGYQGWPEEAPFDRVILTASPPEIPQTLIDQLARGGRLVAPVGRLGSQELVLIEKKADGTLRRRSVLPVAFVPMKPGLP